MMLRSACTLALSSSASAGATVKVDTQVGAQASYRTELKEWTYQRLETQFKLTAEGDESVPSWMGALSLRVEVQGRRNFGRSADDASPSELQLKSFFLQYRTGDLRLQAGLQELNWGELLGPSLLDLTNPRDLREPGELIKSLEKVPERMVVVSWNPSFLKLEAFATPQAEELRLPQYLDDRPLVTAHDDPSAEFGVRLGQVFGAWDLKVYGIRHQSRLPLLVPSLGEDGEARFLARTRLEQSLGGSGSFSWDAFVVRSEVLWSRVESRQKDEPIYQQSRQHALALDYSTETQWLFMGQLQGFSWQDCPLSSCPNDEIWSSLLVQKNLSDPNITISAFVFIRQEDGASYRKEELQWQSPWQFDLGMIHEAFDRMRGLPWELLGRADRWAIELKTAF